MLTIEDLQAGCMNISKVVSTQWKHSFDQFESFLQVLEVFGSGYTEDITPKKHRLRDKESHRLSAVKSI